MKDIAPGAVGGVIGPLQRVGDLVYFAANDGVSGAELWKSDGTASGTQMVTDLLPGPRGSKPTHLQQIGTTLLFTADDGLHGAELFESDGTAAGTRLVADLRVGPEPSYPGRVERAGSTVYFAAFASRTNRQIFALSHADAIPPTVSCPADIAEVANDAAGKVVTYAPATAIDEFSSVALTYSHPSSSLFPEGVTRVTVTATDESGNAASCTFQVTIALEDLVAPTLQCSEGVTVTTEDPGGAVVEFAAPVVTDALDPSPDVTSSHASGARFPVGTTQVNVTATDASSNSNSCSFTVTVVLFDETPPTVMCPADQTVTAPNDPTGAVVSWSNPVVTDNISAQVAVTYSSASGTRHPVGTTPVQVVATDEAGNSATCTFSVTVVLEDTLPPSLTCPATVSVTTTSTNGATVTYPAATATDAVDPNPTVTYSRPSGTRFPLGTTTVVVTATDASGHLATCSFSVNVSLQDDTPPTLQCPANVTTTASGPGGAVVTYAPAQVSDSQDPNPTVTYSRPSGSTFPLGVSSVNVVATDASNNTSSCSFTVTVTHSDRTPPSLVCPNDVLIVPAADATGAVVTFEPADVTDDFDSTPTVHYSRASGTRFPVGVTTVTVTATDASNNSDACEFTVEVQLEQSGPGGTDAGTTPGNLPDAGSGAPPDEVNSGGCGATGGTGPSTLLALFAFSWAAGLRRRLGR